MNLKLDILNLLAQQDLRPSKIREMLLPNYAKRRGYSKRSFDVIINRELSKLGKFVKRKDKGHQRVFYSINKRGLEEIERIKVKNLTDSLDSKWLYLLRRLLIRVTHEGEDPEAFLNNNCITFIGDIPCAFNMSVEAMQSQLALKRSLYQRHARDLERFREEFIKADVINRERIDARIREEVGWTVGEYLRKLLKKTEKQKGVRKMMTVLGITDEMLEEIDRENLR